MPRDGGGRVAVTWDGGRPADSGAGGGGAGAHGPPDLPPPDRFLTQPRAVAPGTVSWAPPTDSIPLGSRYLLHGRIGRGGMGEVWRGSVAATGAPVAVKLMRPELSDDADMMARFLRERALLDRVRSPNVVAVRDLVVDGGRVAIVMDLVEGTDLRRLLAARGTLPPAQAVEIVIQILAGLHAVHQAGVVHRDLKPENVLLEPAAGGAPVARLTDFGIAHLAHGISQTRRSLLIGTPEYMAPEAAEAGGATPASDLYAVGILLYELLAGRTPFGGESPLAVLRRQADAVVLRPPSIPASLWAIIDRLLAKQPEARFASAQEAIDALRSLAPSLAGIAAAPPVAEPDLTTAVSARPTRQLASHPAPSPAQPPPRPRSPVRRRRALVAAAVVLTLAGSGLATWMMAGGRTASQLVASGSAPAPRVMAFSPAVLRGGLVDTRTWSYAPASGDLTATLHLSNPTSSAVSADVDEVIAKTLAPSAASIRFSPLPDAIVQADPVVRYHVANLPPGATMSVRYDLTVAARASDRTLDQWVTDESVATAMYRPALTLEALTMTPSAVAMTVGERVQLSMTGRMSDGSPAPASVLGAVRLTSSNPGVAGVAGVTITGLKIGTAAVSAPAGIRAAAVSVTVVPPTAAPTAASTTAPAVSTASGTLRPATPAPTLPPTAAPAATPPPAAPPPPPNDTLYPGSTLANLQQLTSANGAYRLVMQNDGNLVLYGPPGGPFTNGAWWCTGIRSAGAFAVFQTDGNFVVYTTSGTALWASHTVGAGGDRLIVQNDGNVVMYTASNVAVWASQSAPATC